MAESEKSPRSPAEWLGVFGFSILLGAVFFGIDVLIGSEFHPNSSLLEAATHAGGSFGFMFTLIVCPGITIYALGRFLVSLFRNHEK